MIYNYKIGYYSHEESDYVELQHDKKFSDNELTEMIADTTVETIKKMKQTDNDYRHSFQDIFEDSNFVQCLIEKFDFKRIEYELCINIFGWGSVFDKSDWKGDRGDHLDKITDIVNKAGFSMRDDSYLREDDERNQLQLRQNHIQAMEDLEQMGFFR